MTKATRTHKFLYLIIEDAYFHFFTFRSPPRSFHNVKLHVLPLSGFVSTRRQTFIFFSSDLQSVHSNHKSTVVDSLFAAQTNNRKIIIIEKISFQIKFWLSSTLPLLTSPNGSSSR